MIVYYVYGCDNTFYDGLRFTSSEYLVRFMKAVGYDVDDYMIGIDFIPDSFDFEGGN